MRVGGFRLREVGLLFQFVSRRTSPMKKTREATHTLANAVNTSSFNSSQLVRRRLPLLSSPAGDLVPRSPRRMQLPSTAETPRRIESRTRQQIESILTTSFRFCLRHVPSATSACRPFSSFWTLSLLPFSPGWQLLRPPPSQSGRGP